MSNELSCKCCNSTVKFLGNLDFNKSCHDRINGRVFPVSEINIPYNICSTCGFIFTTHMDNWTSEDFKTKIYNDDYHKADGALPGYENAKPRETISYKNGIRLFNLLNGSQNEIRVLDYGSSGNPGNTGLALIDNGFDLFSYEPYLYETTDLPQGKFDFIYLIEVIEHCHNVEHVAEELSSIITRDGLIHIQTLLHPFPAQDNILNSWYISPRNGHISIFTFQSLAILFRKFGINIVNTLHGIVGFKDKPGFKNHFIF